MKEEVLFNHNRQPRTNPIRHNREKVFENPVEMVPTSNGAGELDEHDENAPGPARHGFGVPPERLNAQCCYVSAGRVVLDCAEGEDDDAEASEASEAVEAG